MIYYAITIKDGVITGVHESALPFEPDVFDGNPWLSGHELRQVEKGDWREGVRIECYDEDGKQKDIVWCIEQGYMDVPEGKELIDGELVDKAVTPEDAPPTLRERLEAAEAAAQVAEDSQKASRVMFRALAQTDVITAEDALDNAGMFPVWRAGEKAVVGAYWRHEDVLYRVVQAHMTQEGWEPDKVPALFAKTELQGEYRVIPDPITAEQAFSKDEIGIWTDGKKYRAKNDGTVWTPDQYPAAWEVVE